MIIQRPSLLVSSPEPLFRESTKRFAAMFQRSAAARAVLFLVRPLTDDYLVEQLAVCGTCVFPLVWRVSDHNTRLCCQSRAVGPFKRSGPVEGYVRRCS